MNDKNELKTLKYIKWMKYAIHSYLHSAFHNTELFVVAKATVYLWIMNPMVLLVSAAVVKTYLKERRDEEKRKAIGKRWTSMFSWNLVAMIAWMITGLCIVLITGGV